MHPVFVRFRTYDGHYLCAENQGGGEVNATRIVPHEWETFGVVRDPEELADVAGDLLQRARRFRQAALVQCYASRGILQRVG